MSDEIAGIQKHIGELEDELNSARHRLYLLQLEAADIQVGMVVSDLEGKVYRVTAAQHFNGHGQPLWLMGNLRKKDGTFGVNRNIYSPWKKLEATND